MLPQAFDVTDKVVFITGAGRGIGKGIAQVLAEAGADVAINSLTSRYVEGVAAEIAAASGRKVVPVVADGHQNRRRATGDRPGDGNLWAH